MSTQISTVNVNGLRAAARKGFVEWLAACGSDIVCLQEVRAEPDQIPAAAGAPDGWHVTIAPSTAKGRAGVALYTRTRPDAVRTGFGTDGPAAEFTASGRYLEADLGPLTVASLYLPSGEVGTERQDEKERFMDAFLPYLAQRRTDIEAHGRHLVVCGDFNIAHTEADLKNWRNNRKSSGFLPEERAWLTRLLDDTGYVDVVRTLHPATDGPYSWWSYRGRAFDNDTGWRIDYQMSTPATAARATRARVERAPSHTERWSDHAPVTVAYDM